MKKDFSEWMKLKSSIQNSDLPRPKYQEREVWWVSIGINVGHEEDGKGALSLRPVLILKGFSPELFMGIALSTTKRRGRFHYAFNLNNRTSVALLTQLRPFDSLRLARKMGRIDKADFKNIRQRILSTLQEP